MVEEFFVFLVLSVVYFFWDTYPLKKEKKTKAFLSASVLLAFSFVIRALYIYNVKIPSPVPYIKALFTGLFGA